VRVSHTDPGPTRGKLTIFFGAASGVGKTYTMLEAARLEASDQKRDVAVGIVETHGHYDTGALLIGLDLVRTRKGDRAGAGEATPEELDLDSAIERRPDLILVDDLAHTNAPGSRHVKRWQDVEELLSAGIDVFTTLNVQHLESLNDVVAQVTGVVVRETVPDAVFDKADEVRVVDLPVVELLDRLRDGQVALPERGQRSAGGFFKEGGLIALRELALRRTAERVDAQMRGYKAAHGIDETWHTGERVLVCISASPHSAQLLRGARRMASSVHAELLAVHVETPAARRLPESERARLAAHMRLAEQLGGEAVTIRGEHAAEEAVRLARKRNVTKIAVGKPTHSRWRDIIKQPFVDQVVRLSGEMDVFVISEPEASVAPRASRQERGSRESPWGYGVAFGAVALSTLVSGLAFGRSELTDVVMIYLLGIVGVSMRFGYGPALSAAVASVVTYDFFFLPPYFSVAVANFRHVVTLIVMLLVAGILSHLTQRIRDQTASARDREQRTISLYAISRELAVAQTLEVLFAAAARHVHDVFDGAVCVLLPAEGDGLAVAHADPGSFRDELDREVAKWVWTHQRPAGVGTDTLPSARGLFVPLKGARGRVGILGLVPARHPIQLRNPDGRQLLETFAGVIGSAIERTQLAEEARLARLRVDTEQLRNSLLSSVSHDLRTPLTVVTGAAAALLDRSAPKSSEQSRELLETIYEEGERLNRLVRNLLDMTRLEAGALRVNKELQPIEEVIGAALNRTEDRLGGRKVSTHVPGDLPLVPLDAVLIEQVLINLIENATKHAPSDSPIDVSAFAGDGVTQVEVADRGPGVPAQDAERVFEKFYRARHEGGGVGLGLAICRGIVSAHGGRVWVEPREGGGASFRFTLPLGSAPDARSPIVHVEASS
jgi:two-component system sensor histidine kinase KdpD